MDSVVNLGAVIYGLLLVLATFTSTPLTDALRVDALFLGRTDGKTRLLNLIVGVLVAGYGAWKLLGG